jgi:O-antigen/teichoic acid export membrane protein
VRNVPGPGALSPLVTDREFPFVGLSGGRTLLRDTGWNFAGYLVPLVAGIVAVPILLDALGIDRFGVLLLAVAVLGYFALFDMGIGRATIKYVAEGLAAGRHEDLRALAWTSISMLGLLGVAGGVALAALTPLLVERVLDLPAALAHESQVAFLLLAASLPAVLMTPGARGVLEAQQRFAALNLVKVPANVALFALPLAVLPFSKSLVPIVAVLVASRYMVLGVYLALAVAALPEGGGRPTRAHARLVAPFAGWTALNNGVGLLMIGGYADRFLITSLLSVRQAAYYATAFEVINRLWIVSAGLLTVVFPTFSALAGDHRGLATVHRRTIRYVWLLLMPVAVVAIAAAEPLLTAWVGASFAERSGRVLQLLVIGLVVNSLAQVAFALVQAVGRPDLTAKRHIVELPVYVALMLLVIPGGGIRAAAAVWLAWAWVDAAILLALVRRLVPECAPSRELALLFGSAALLLALALAAGEVPSGLGQGLAAAAACAVTLAVGVGIVLEPGEREALRRVARRSARGRAAAQQTGGEAEGRPEPDDPEGEQ